MVLIWTIAAFALTGSAIAALGLLLAWMSVGLTRSPFDNEN